MITILNQIVPFTGCFKNIKGGKFSGVSLLCLYKYSLFKVILLLLREYKNSKINYLQQV